jgi:hypothetical protein
VADRAGPDTHLPKGRRTPQMPDATSIHVIQARFTPAVVEPTNGGRQFADRLEDQGFSIAKSTVQRHLVAHGLGHRSHRLARVATTGPVAEAAREDDPFGPARPTVAPMSWSAWTPATRAGGRAWEKFTNSPPVRSSPAGPSPRFCSARSPTTTSSASPSTSCAPIGARIGFRAVLADYRPEYVAGGFQAHLAARGFHHRCIPHRSPTHDASCEWPHQMILQEGWRPAFHRRHFTSTKQHRGEADDRPVSCNRRHRDHGD